MCVRVSYAVIFCALELNYPKEFSFGAPVTTHTYTHTLCSEVTCLASSWTSVFPLMFEDEVFREQNLGKVYKQMKAWEETASKKSKNTGGRASREEITNKNKHCFSSVISNPAGLTMWFQTENLTAPQKTNITSAHTNCCTLMCQAWRLWDQHICY